MRSIGPGRSNSPSHVTRSLRSTLALSPRSAWPIGPNSSGAASRRSGSSEVRCRWRPSIGESEWQAFPSLAEALAETNAINHDQEFEQGLDIIITGLAPTPA